MGCQPCSGCWAATLAQLQAPIYLFTSEIPQAGCRHAPSSSGGTEIFQKRTRSGQTTSIRGPAGTHSTRPHRPWAPMSRCASSLFPCVLSEKLLIYHLFCLCYGDSAVPTAGVLKRPQGGGWCHALAVGLGHCGWAVGSYGGRRSPWAPALTSRHMSEPSPTVGGHGHDLLADNSVAAAEDSNVTADMLCCATPDAIPSAEPRRGVWRGFGAAVGWGCSPHKWLQPACLLQQWFWLRAHLMSRVDRNYHDTSWHPDAWFCRLHCSSCHGLGHFLWCCGAGISRCSSVWHEDNPPCHPAGLRALCPQHYSSRPPQCGATRNLNTAL
ncbi:uncharacterized protein LOC109370686 [Meleagris gallopavo]|uniref:uncharacterized protein LOC109370686 n=1 Tax=Meleagris gallopavo TaxID=9103 RepID=UPI00093B39E7|nr:uncharacterized protein LOC109370686 [Meleagris gallopavo]